MNESTQSLMWLAEPTPQQSFLDFWLPWAKPGAKNNRQFLYRIGNKNG